MRGYIEHVTDVPRREPDSFDHVMMGIMIIMAPVFAPLYYFFFTILLKIGEYAYDRYQRDE